MHGPLAGTVVVPLGQELLGGGGLLGGRAVCVGADQDQRGDAFGRDQRGAQRGAAALRGSAYNSPFGAEVIEHRQRVARGGPVSERQTFVPGAAVAARIPGDDPEFRCQRGHLGGEHGAVHEELVR